MNCIQNGSIYHLLLQMDIGFQWIVSGLEGSKRCYAHLDSWEKKIAPSNELRKWFHHDPQRFEIFKTKYWEELEQNGEAQRLVEIVRKQLETQNVTLLYGAKDTQDNQAVVLKEWLLEKLVPSKTL